MKIYFLFFSLVIISSTEKCNSKKEPEELRGRLEVKGICMNYTIKLLEGKLDTSQYVLEWKDEVTGKIHTNVFALGSPCTFPSNIREGDEFRFVIDPSPPGDCTVCLAYYPKPKKSLAIKVISD